jgi:hypothetical protein
MPGIADCILGEGDCIFRTGVWREDSPYGRGASCRGDGARSGGALIPSRPSKPLTGCGGCCIPAIPLVQSDTRAGSTAGGCDCWLDADGAPH